jgi:two-component system sensor kinase ParS
MLVRRLVIKFYILLVTSVAALGFIIDYFIQQDAIQNSQYSSSNHHISIPRYVEDILIATPEELWSDKIEQISNDLSIKIILLELDDIDIDKTIMLSLDKNELVTLTLNDKDILLKKIVSANKFIQIEIPYSELKNNNWAAAFYLLLVIPILFWFWPLAKDLDQLEKATKEISNNNFNYRIPDKPNSAINSISRTFNAMAKRIKYLIEEQKSLTSAVSHEIRTPLARLKFALELQKKTSFDQAAHLQISAMQNDVKELSSLVDEMLSYARLDKINEVIELQSVPAKKWLETVIDECKKSNSTINIQLKCEVQFITIDPHLMARAISNLIHNAFRFAKSNILVQVVSLSKGFKIIVSDDGPGIPDNQKERLFEPFAKIDMSRNKKKQGYGLGLAIVKRIIEKHQGQITIIDSGTGGAQFELTIGG